MHDRSFVHSPVDAYHMNILIDANRLVPHHRFKQENFLVHRPIEVDWQSIWREKHRGEIGRSMRQGGKKFDCSAASIAYTWSMPNQRDRQSVQLLVGIARGVVLLLIPSESPISPTSAGNELKFRESSTSILFEMFLNLITALEARLFEEPTVTNHCYYGSTKRIIKSKLHCKFHAEI